MLDAVPATRKHATRTDNNGTSPFHAACAGGHLDLLRWLHEEAPDACVETGIKPDKDGKTPFYTACARGHFPVLNWLNEELYSDESIPGGRMAVKQAAQDGTTPFLAACIAGRLDVVKWLVARVPETHSTTTQANKYGQTPFSVSCARHHLKLAQWLYASIPETRHTVAQADAGGATPFAVSCRSNVDKASAIVMWLAELPSIRPELLLANKTAVNPLVWEKLAPFVAFEQASRVVELARMLRQRRDTSRGAGGEDARETPRGTQSDYVIRLRVLRKVALPVFYDVVNMLAPR